MAFQILLIFAGVMIVLVILMEMAYVVTMMNVQRDLFYMAKK